jgi:CheY-like chemotaxis protein
MGPQRRHAACFTHYETARSNRPGDQRALPFAGQEKEEDKIMPRILIIDDEVQIRKMLQQMFEREGYDTVTAPDGREGVKAYRENPTDLIITDLIMPEKEGIEIIFELKREFPDVKIIAMSGGGRTEPHGYLKIAEKAGALRTFRKPLEREELLKAVREILG